jgi:hypothetical protein
MNKVMWSMNKCGIRIPKNGYLIIKKENEFHAKILNEDQAETHVRRRKKLYGSAEVDKS